MKIYHTEDVALTFINDIPAIGPLLPDKEDALKITRSYLCSFEKMTRDKKEYHKCSLRFIKQKDGRFTLVVRGSGMAIETLRNLDELMLQRFKRGLTGNMFILTGFFGEPDGKTFCLALTEGIGAVLYSPL